MNKKNCIMALMCALSVLLSSFVLGFESEAAGRQNNYYYRQAYFYSDYFSLDGQYDSEFNGIVQNELPYGVATVRIPLDLFRYENANVDFNTDFIWWRSQGLTLGTEFLVDSGSWRITPLSCTLIGNNQNFPISFNTNDWPSAVFDMKNFNNIVSDFGLDSYQIMDLFYVDVTFSYQLISGFNSDDTYTDFPQLRFRFYLYSPTMEFYGLNEGDSLYSELENFHNDMVNGSSDDKGKTDNFTNESDSQSSTLDSLNEQNKMDKIDVDNASSSVDANIDGNAIANYGVVLSSITGNGKVIQLMLIVLSIGLVSYVLFGKR